MGKKKDKAAKLAAAGTEVAREDGRVAGKAYNKEIARLQVELAYLQRWVKDTGARIVIIFEGRDAAGKGGIIRRITERVSPRVFRVVALPSPSDREKSQMFLQRYVQHLPAAGEIVIFDRSWYNRPGVERVMGFCTDEQAHRFLEVVPRFEGTLIESGITHPEVLPRRQRGGAGAPLPPADRRPAAPVEAQPDGHRSPTASGGTTRPPTRR